MSYLFLKNKYDIDILISDNNENEETRSLITKFDEINYVKNTFNKHIKLFSEELFRMYQSKYKIKSNDHYSRLIYKILERKFIFKNSKYDRKFFYNQANYYMGIDSNIHNCVLNSNSKYVWLLSDNDKIDLKNFDIFYKYIRQFENLDLIYVNADNKPLFEHDLTFKTYNSINKFHDTINYNNGALSSNIINKDSWLNIFPSKYIGRNWMHFEYLIRVIEKNNYSLASFKFNMVNAIPIQTQKWGKEGAWIFYSFMLLNLFNSIKDKKFKKKI